MSHTQELERLAKLHAEGKLTPAEFTQAKQRLLSTPARFPTAFQGIRRQSVHKVFGWPLWSVALGPDWAHGEMRGHARGIFAFGDIATGGLACGGLARGLVAIGGLALGVVALGGGAIGLLAAIGGASVGGFALGGAAFGAIAVGGGACGYYALGGAAAGVHTISALNQDPAALAFFQQYLPWLMKLLSR